jgi:hypothetical protein
MATHFGEAPRVAAEAEAMKERLRVERNPGADVDRGRGVAFRSAASNHALVRAEGAYSLATACGPRSGRG